MALGNPRLTAAWRMTAPQSRTGASKTSAMTVGANADRRRKVETQAPPMENPTRITRLAP